MITPRSFDPSKPRELQVKLAKKWEIIGKDFAIEEKVIQTPPASENDARSILLFLYRNMFVKTFSEHLKEISEA